VWGVYTAGVRLLRIYDCEDCGKRTMRYRDPDQPWVCDDCSLDRAEMAARQMAARQGPYWDRFVAAMTARGRPPAQNAKG
jgi:ribosomal protein L37AE/L43A